MIAPRVSNSQPPLFVPWRCDSAAGAGASAEAVVPRPGRVHFEAGENARQGISGTSGSQQATVPAVCSMSPSPGRSACPVPGCRCPSRSDRLTPPDPGAAGCRPKRQRGLAESQQAPARSYFCSARKAGVSSRRSTSLSKIVLGGSETGDERDASSRGIAEEPVLAGVGPIQRPASVLPTAVRAVEAEVIRLRHLSRITARPARCCSLRERASRKSAGRRPSRPRGRRRRGRFHLRTSDSQRVC